MVYYIRLKSFKGSKRFKGVQRYNKKCEYVSPNKLFQFLAVGEGVAYALTEFDIAHMNGIESD